MPFARRKDDTPQDRGNSPSLLDSLLDEASDKSLQIGMLKIAMQDIIRQPDESASIAARSLGYLKVWEEVHGLRVDKDDARPWAIELKHNPSMHDRLPSTINVQLRLPDQTEPEVVHRQQPDLPNREPDGTTLEAAQKWAEAYREGLCKAAPHRSVELNLDPLDPAPPEITPNPPPLASP